MRRTDIGCGLRAAAGRAKKAHKARRGRMKSRVKSLAALVIAGGSAVATVAPAHHAMVMYDRTRVQTLTGTVVELQWTNPHVFLLVNGKVDEAEEAGVWRLETSGPANLTRQGGWSATALKPGDRVRIEINPIKEAGQRNGRLNKVTNVDTGEVLGASYLDLDLRR
jgi:ribosomal protein L21E